MTDVRRERESKQLITWTIYIFIIFTQTRVIKHTYTINYTNTQYQKRDNFFGLLSVWERSRWVVFILKFGPGLAKANI